MAFTLCTSNAIVIQAGEYIADAVAEGEDTILTQFSEDAEAYVCEATRYDWIKNQSIIGALSSYAAYALSSAVSCIAANKAVKYDQAGWPSRIMAENVININYDEAGRAISYLKELKKPEDNF